MLPWRWHVPLISIALVLNGAHWLATVLIVVVTALHTVPRGTTRAASYSYS